MKKTKQSLLDPEPFPYEEKNDRITFIEGISAGLSVAAIILALMKIFT